MPFAYISHFESKILKRIPKAKNYTDSEIQTTIFGAIQFLSSFLWWGLWFYFEFWFLFWSVLGYASLRPDCVILNWVCLCVLLGIAYFCLGSLFLTPDYRWVTIFRFGYVCFCAGLAGYIFEPWVFIFVPFGHTICMLKTCHWTFVAWHAQPIISIPEITPSLLYLDIFFVIRGHDAMMHLFVRSPAIYVILSN